MTVSSPWYGALYDLLGKALPATKGLPSSEWSNNPDFQRLMEGVKEGLRQRPDPDTEQGKLLGRVDQAREMEGKWQDRDNDRSLRYGSGVLDLRGKQLDQNLGLVTANRDNLTGNTLKLQGGSQLELGRAETENRINEANAKALQSMLPVNAYTSLARDQDSNSLAGLDRTLASRERLQQNAIAAAERQASERNSVGSIVKDLVRSLPAAAAFFV